MALITLEDLDELDEQMNDDVTHDPVTVDDEEEERERLLSHWQAVASAHHVSVPPEMTGPIQEMNRNSHQREAVPFTSISHHEQSEERVEPAGLWVCVRRAEKLYEQSISLAFMKIMIYICKENSAGRYLGMTVPVVSDINMMDDRKSFKKDVLTAVFLPAKFQSCPPEPLDPDVTVVHRDTFRVVTRPFVGTTTDETVSHQMSLLWEILGDTHNVRRNRYMVAAYENPGVACRRNEIWFIRRTP
ncbi:heme-binding protein soul4 [Genypterus blacodes]|uniref:heme-binding protein soul4 n=1 Tax=Genypterus blacodes TaxID=154954 RepID=UPI003F765CDA